MATTFTSATTKTFTRIGLLERQVHVAFRKTTDVDSLRLDLFDIGIENRWIREFSIYALDDSQLCRAELSLSIDWHEHDLQLSVGHAKVVIDERWTDDAAIELDEAIKLFNKFVSAYSLRTMWHVRYTTEVNDNASLRKSVESKLNLVAASAIRWAGGRLGDEMTIPELPECRVGLYLQAD